MSSHMRCVSLLLLLLLEILFVNGIDIIFEISANSTGSSQEDFWVELTHVSGSSAVVGNLTKPQSTGSYALSSLPYPYPPDEVVKVRIAPFENWPQAHSVRTSDGDGVIVKSIYLFPSGSSVRWFGVNGSLAEQWSDYNYMKTNREAIFYPPTTPTAQPTNVPTAQPTDVPTFAPTSMPTTIVPDTHTPPTRIPTTGVPTGIPVTTIPVPNIPTPEPGSAPTETITLVAETETIPIKLLPTGVPLTATPTSMPTFAPTPVPTVYEHPTVSAPVGNAAAAGAVLSSGGAAAGSAMRLVLISGGCQLGGGQHRDLVKDFHFSGIEINNSMALGSIVVHFVALAAITLLFKIASFFLSKCFPRSKGTYNANDPDGFLRFPSAPLLVFQWMYQGTTLCGFLLLLYSGSLIGVSVGCLCILGCAALPIVLAVILKRSIPPQGMYVKDPKQRNPIYLTMLGPGEWVSKYRDNHWVQKYASVVRSLKQECIWFPIVEFLSSFVLSLMSSLELSSKVQCGHVRVAQGVIFVMMMIIEGVMLPHCKPRDCIMSFVMSGGQATALFLLASSFYNDTEESAARTIAEKILDGVSFMLFGQIALDVLSEMYVFFSKRREHMQHQLWEFVDSRDLNSYDSDLFCSRTSFRSFPSMRISFPKTKSPPLFLNDSLLPAASNESACQVISIITEESDTELS